MISKEVNRTSNTSCERLSLAEYIEKVVLAQRSKDVNTKNEKNVLFIGEKSSGKSSLLNVLLGRKGEMRLMSCFLLCFYVMTIRGEEVVK